MVQLIKFKDDYMSTPPYFPVIIQYFIISLSSDYTTNILHPWNHFFLLTCKNVRVLKDNFPKFNMYNESKVYNFDKSLGVISIVTLKSFMVEVRLL